jgi:uncharacterized protein with FMN-binding domain
MSKKQFSQTLDGTRSIKKFVLSAAVIGAFGVYVLYERLANPDGAFNSSVTTSSGLANQGTNAGGSGPIKDGTYTGSEVDAYYGLVKVQTTISAGRITDVQFLEYPQDRRTSVRINSIAVPDLKQEAIQAQTANVDIVSGATLTSEAFRVSMQAALNAAKN